MSKYRIGIDCGVNTGIAIVENGIYLAIETMTITRAISMINLILMDGHEIILYVENPNLRKWYGSNSNFKKQGAGSVKRDYSIWKTYCVENKIMMHAVHPKDIGSQFDNDVIFKAATNWTKRTSIHARDAARMVYKFIKK